MILCAPLILRLMEMRHFSMRTTLAQLMRIQVMLYMRLNIQALHAACLQAHVTSFGPPRIMVRFPKNNVRLAPSGYIL